LGVTGPLDRELGDWGKMPLKEYAICLLPAGSKVVFLGMQPVLAGLH
jgi:hypothetical protein